EVCQRESRIPPPSHPSYKPSRSDRLRWLRGPPHPTSPGLFYFTRQTDFLQPFQSPKSPLLAFLIGAGRPRLLVFFPTLPEFPNRSADRDPINLPRNPRTSNFKFQAISKPQPQSLKLKCDFGR